MGLIGVLRGVESEEKEDGVAGEGVVTCMLVIIEIFLLMSVDFSTDS